MKASPVRLPDGRVWLRVAAPDWKNPLDPTHARRAGGRWNPPDSYDTLYLNGDVHTAQLQIARLLDGSPVLPDDLDDGAYVLVAASLPRAQLCAEATTALGLQAIGLPASYPVDEEGNAVAAPVCQPIGARIREEGLRGVWCRSALTSDGRGRELAWFPATSRSRAHPLWNRPLPYGRWRHAAGWADLGLETQRGPDGE